MAGTFSDVSWEPTAETDQFAASFKGKYTVLVDKGEQRNVGHQVHWLTLKDSDGRELLRVYDYETNDVEKLFNNAQRASLNVDSAISEIIDDIDKAGPDITDEDIPF